jgi:hypothetical protein
MASTIAPVLILCASLPTAAATAGQTLTRDAVDVFRALAKRNGSGPNVKINLAMAYVDKVPTAGDIRRLYLGRDAMNALAQSIADQPSVLAYYLRGQINLYYNRFIFHRLAPRGRRAGRSFQTTRACGHASRRMDRRSSRS